MEAVKIRFYEITKRTFIQFQPTIPWYWLEEMGLKEGDRVNLLKDKEGRLILVPEKREQSS